MRVFLALACAAMTVTTIGCGGGGKGPTGTIEGKLTVDGSPAPQGTVVQFLSDKGAASGTCGADGSFSVMGVPVGTYKVAIMPGAGSADSGGTLSPEEAMMKATEEGFKGMGMPKDSAIPEKFQSVETSGITLEVKEGSNDFVKDIKK